MMICLAGAADGADPGDSAIAGLAEGWYTAIETDRGRIVARLHPEQSPQAVAHFAGLAEGTLSWIDRVTGEEESRRYFDELPVHKIEANRSFYIGDPTGTGAGIPRMYVPMEVGALRFDKPGRLGLAAYSPTHITSAVFFVTAAGVPWLNRQHPVFGTVVEGLDLVREISTVKADQDGRPLEQIRVETVRVFPVGEPAALPEPVPYEPPAKQELRPRQRRNRYIPVN